MSRLLAVFSHFDDVSKVKFLGKFEQNAVYPPAQPRKPLDMIFWYSIIGKFLSGRNDFLFSGASRQRVGRPLWATPMLKDRETFGGGQFRPRPIEF